MRNLKVVIILIVVLSTGLIAMMDNASCATNSDIGVSGMSLIFQDGKPVSQITGSGSVQPFDNTSYDYLGIAVGPYMNSNVLVNWSIYNTYDNTTYAKYLDNKLTGYYTI